MKNFLPLLVAAILGAGLVLGGSTLIGGGKTVGGVYDTVLRTFAAGIQVGDTATKITQMYVGTCNAATTLLPLEATSTDTFTCTVTGAKTGDVVSVSLPNYDLAFGSLSVVGATASTNTISFGIMNSSGAATSSFPVATTSVKYQLMRTSVNP